MMSMSKKLLFTISIMMVSIGATYADNKALPTSQATIENYAKNEVRQKARVGAFARLKMASSRFVNKVVDTASACFCKIYRTANGTVYVVGLTTIGFVVYCYFKGQLIDVKYVENTDYFWQLTGVPFFGKAQIQIPTGLVENLVGAKNTALAAKDGIIEGLKTAAQISSEKLDRAGQLAIQVKDYLKEQSQGFVEVASKLPEGSTKKIAEVATEVCQEGAEMATHIVEVVQS